MRGVGARQNKLKVKFNSENLKSPPQFRSMADLNKFKAF
jgi:hypothetical protein